MSERRPKKVAALCLLAAAALAACLLVFHSVNPGLQAACLKRLSPTSVTITKRHGDARQQWTLQDDRSARRVLRSIVNLWPGFGAGARASCPLNNGTVYRFAFAKQGTKLVSVMMEATGCQRAQVTINPVTGCAGPLYADVISRSAARDPQFWPSLGALLQRAAKPQ